MGSVTIQPPAIIMPVPFPPSIRRSLTLGTEEEEDESMPTPSPSPPPRPPAVDLPQIGCLHYEDVEKTLAAVRRLMARCEVDCDLVDRLDGHWQRHETVIKNQARSIDGLLQHINFLTQQQSHVINAMMLMKSEIIELSMRLPVPALSVRRSTTPLSVKPPDPV